MNPNPLSLPRGALLFSLLTALFLGAGCSSDGGRPPKREGGHRKPFPTMAGQETFFNGGITAEVLVGAMTGFDHDAAPGGGGEGGRRHGGGGGHMRMGGGMGMGGGGGGGMGGGGGGPRGGGGPGSEGGGGGGDEEPGRVQASATRRADAMGSPPVLIHLRFTNASTTPADVVIADFLSPLGNFVVQPEKLALAPGQSLEVEPMTSRLAGEVTTGEITLSLRLGSEKETKTITLALKPEPAAPAGPDGPPPAAK